MRPSESVVMTASPMDCRVTWARSLAWKTAVSAFLRSVMSVSVPSYPVTRPCLSRTTRLESMTTSMEPSLRRKTYSSLRSSPSLSTRRTKVSRSLAYQYNAAAGTWYSSSAEPYPIRFTNAGFATRMRPSREVWYTPSIMLSKSPRNFDSLLRRASSAPRRSMAIPAICAIRDMSSWSLDRGIPGWRRYTAKVPTTCPSEATMGVDQAALKPARCAAERRYSHNASESMSATVIWRARYTAAEQDP